MNFDDVVVGHLQWIARLAFRFYRSKADADDLAQETLCRIYANRDKFNHERDFKPWALTIMANLFKSQYARRERVGFDALDVDADALSPSMADDEVLFDDLLCAIHRSAQRTVGVECVMLYAEGYSYDEISNIVGINPGTVKSRISAGRRVLRTLLAG